MERLAEGLLEDLADQMGGTSVWFMVAEGRVHFQRLIQGSPYEFNAINCVNNCVNAIINAINCVILQDWMIL